MTRAPQVFHESALLGMLASGFLAVLGSGELDLPTALVMSAALLIRALMVAGIWKSQIPIPLVTALAAGYVLFYPVDYLWLSQSFVTATVHMIFFLAAVKILTAKTSRDFLYVKVIALLEMLAAALLSTQLNFFLYLAAFLLCAIAAFAGGEVMRPMREGVVVSKFRARVIPSRLGMLTGVLFCGIIVLTAGLFFVLPRTARAAFQRFVPQRYQVGGFGSEVTLGELGELKQSSAAVMHVLSLEDRPLTAMRWRGAVLGRFDGRRWFNPAGEEDRMRVMDGQLILPPVPQIRPGRRMSYAVRMSEIAPDTLFFLGAPESIGIQSGNLFRSPSGTIRAPRFSMTGLRYAAKSWLENEWAPPQNAVIPLLETERAELLALPAIDGRVALLAQEWTAGLRDPATMAREIERHLQHDFHYTLELLDREVPDPLAHFLFVRKKGHCEYFASAMAVMLRTQGIPSRVATGFYGGEFNPISGWQILRASDAHSWVEAWIPSRGWVTFDPTPAAPAAGAPSLWSQARLLLDAADQFWRDWVLTYDLEHQQVLAGRMQSAGRAWRGLGWPDWERAAQSLELRWTFALVMGTLAAGLFWKYGAGWLAWWTRRRRLAKAQRGEARASDATLLYERMLTLLDKRGFRKPAWVTPREFAGMLPTSEMALLVEDLTDAYNQVRFGGRGDAAPRMARLLRRLETLLA